MTAVHKQAVVPERLRKAVEAVRQGRMVLMTDDVDRENEGDLVLAAQFATPKALTFMAREGCGLICLCLTPDHVDRLGLAPMVQNNQDPRGTAFTVSVEAAHGVTTGISASDRAHTIKLVGSSQSQRGDFVSPGHIFPLRAAPGGVLQRQGHTEGSLDLMKLAGLEPSAAIVEVMGPDGEMLRGAALEDFAATHNLPMISIAELRSWIAVHGLQPLAPTPQSQKEATPASAGPAPAMGAWAQAKLPTALCNDDMRVHAYRDSKGQEHLALVLGDVSGQGAAPLIRVHSECVTGDALGSKRCDCGPQLQAALARIREEGRGILLYMRGHEGRGVGLFNKICAYGLQDKGLDTVEANVALGLPVDGRQWHVAATMLKGLGVHQVRLMTNNPGKAQGLEDAGMTVAGLEPLQVGAGPYNGRYLETKRVRMGHLLKAPAPGGAVAAPPPSHSPAEGEGKAP
ncbi:3,4-dihydroxy-2-butanone-4-phosphate synthase [Formicincola oecophyllae]|uniref:Multifunctional fusion protein n=1 Tax=Formicincola oecophyllae TaxID=2558361 RepID=A0A4Y6U870_9PROT|nr:3,4-dihydroxy-2-butanone-4-phosphate synthase [Formicincola oecophyllae]QDH13552.1 3,4-dihydroxy-2-butanone-4-phosphate synthase [Formicincola oecophyllae]